MWITLVMVVFAGGVVVGDPHLERSGGREIPEQARLSGADVPQTLEVAGSETGQ